MSKLTGALVHQYFSFDIRYSSNRLGTGTKGAPLNLSLMSESQSPLILANTKDKFFSGPKDPLSTLRNAGNLGAG